MGYIREERQEFFALTAQCTALGLAAVSALGAWQGEGAEAVQQGLLASAGGVVLGRLLVVLAT